jgi:hypothetical protein
VLSIAAITACLIGAFIWLVIPFPTEAQRYVYQVEVHGYDRTHDYLDFGTGPAEGRAAVAIFVGTPDDDVLARISAPELVVEADTEHLGIRGFDLIGTGDWHGCGVLVERAKAHAFIPSDFGLTVEQLAEFRAEKLWVLSISVGCIQ